MKQIRTFQFRLPKGDHDAVLDAWGDLAGKALRSIHVELRRAHLQADQIPMDERKDFLRIARNGLKSATIQRFGITGRQYNGLLVQLTGLWDSRRALAKLDAERLDSKVKKKRKAVANLRKKVDKDKAARKAIAKKSAKAVATGKPAPLPTRSQANALLGVDDRKAIRFSLHQGSRKLQALERDLGAAVAASRSDCVPKVVFGGKHMVRKRRAIHPNDSQSLASWRKLWDMRRSAGFMVIGGSDEAAGNKSCKMTLDGAGKVKLDLRLPDGLGQGFHLSIRGIGLPGFGRDEIEAAMGRNIRPGHRIALTYRFVRDPDFRSETASAWRVCVTMSTEVEVPKPSQMTLGIDVNVDHLAVALVDRDGNPKRSWTVPLALRGKSTEQREAIIGEAAVTVVSLAEENDAEIALEALDFGKKKREIGDANKRGLPGEKRYARMLSSFAYAQISTAIERRAQRRGIVTHRVNPAYTSLIGEVNYARRYGLTRHEAAAVAIARRARGHSERINYIHGSRGCRSTLPAPEEARRHVWRRWAVVHRERIASAGSASRKKPAYPPDRGASPGPNGRGNPVA